MSEMSPVHVGAVTEPGTGPTQRVGPDREFTVRERSQTRMVLSRFFRHRLAVASLVVLGLIVVFAFVGPLLWTYDHLDITDDLSHPPSGRHPFGTDSVGHDTMAQVMRGIQQSIKIALSVALISTVIGSIFGAVAGYYRGRADTVMMRVVDILLTIPVIALAAALGFLGFSSGNWWAIAVVLGALGWPYVSRVVRGVVLSLREQEFVEAARALGASDARIIMRHLLPNAVGPIIVVATIYVAAAILSETALSFLGFGVRAPDTSLGLMVTLAKDALQTRPWLFYLPGIFIILIALTINFIGDGLRDAFDPRQTRVRQ
ncbi:MAG TPA: ABC transporter permease [Micromonosporaceae bacterium]|nr:ABC transporter permease [Micromonosporaceae bacterium]